REVVAVAEELGCSASHVALAWTRLRGQQVIPIIGARRAEQLTESLGVLNVELPAEAVKRLDAVSTIELGFPHDFLQSEGVLGAMGNSIQMINKTRR
ncbi:MAG: aldo/keto reductase, partial [Candidatus Kapabacteria bacterium]|nr:aldo/keto reductase [Candidatus Kapabacteria bacterium]